MEFHAFAVPEGSRFYWYALRDALGYRVDVCICPPGLTTSRTEKQQETPDATVLYGPCDTQEEVDQYLCDLDPDWQQNALQARWTRDNLL